MHTGQPHERLTVPSQEMDTYPMWSWDRIFPTKLDLCLTEWGPGPGHRQGQAIACHGTDKINHASTCFLSGLDIEHLIYMPVGHLVLKIYMPCKNFHVPSQYLYKPCKAYVHCWENKYMPRLKTHLPCRARNHKSLCALRQDLHAPGMRARLNVEPCLSMLLYTGPAHADLYVTLNHLSMPNSFKEMYLHCYYFSTMRWCR